jgi:chromosome partitioning protein
MTVYALINAKGGVGKSTSTVNLGAAFAELGKNVLLCDLDPQGGLTTSLGYDPDEFDHTVYHVFIEECEFPQIIIKTKIANISLAPANLDLSGAEGELVREIGWDRILPGALQPIKAEYDIIMFDCPPSLGVLTLSALTTADIALVPLQCEFLAFRALKQLNKIIAKTKRRTNPDLEMLIFRTMYDSRTSHAREVFEEIEKIAGNRVLKTYIKRTVKVADATISGKSLLAYDATSEVANAYRNLAQELLSREKETVQKEKKNE